MTLPKNNTLKASQSRIWTSSILTAALLSSGCQTESYIPAYDSTRHSSPSSFGTQPANSGDSHGNSILTAARKASAPRKFIYNGQELPFLYGAYEGYMIRARNFTGAGDVKPVEQYSKTKVTLYMHTDEDSSSAYLYTTLDPAIKKVRIEFAHHDGTVAKLKARGGDYWNDARIFEDGKGIITYTRDSRHEGRPAKEKMVLLYTGSSLNKTQTSSFLSYLEDQQERQNSDRSGNLVVAGVIGALMLYGGYKLGSSTVRGVRNAALDGATSAREAGDRGEISVWKCDACGKALHLTSGKYPNTGTPCTKENNTWAGTVHDWEVDYTYFQ